MATEFFRQMGMKVWQWQTRLAEVGRLMEKLYSSNHDRSQVSTRMREVANRLTRLKMETQSDFGELDKIKLMGNEAIPFAAGTMDEMKSAAGNIRTLAERLKNYTVKNDATRVLSELSRLESDRKQIENMLHMAMGFNKPKIEKNNFSPKLYLRFGNTQKFTFQGPPWMYAGIKIVHLANSGGHKQSVEEEKQEYSIAKGSSKQQFKDFVGSFAINGTSAAGQFDILQGVGFKLPENNKPVEITYTHRNFSGEFLVRACLSDHRSMLQSILNGFGSSAAAFEKWKFTAIAVEGLEPLSDFKSGRKDDNDINIYYDGNLALYQGDPEYKFHTNEDSHYGKPALNAKLREVGRLFAAKFPGNHVWINDMSLPWGGRFKTGQVLRGGHGRHNAGEDADISFNKLANNASGDKLKAQRIELDKIIKTVFQDRYYRFHGGPGLWHWHVSTGSYTTEKLSMMNGLIVYYEKHEIKRDKILREIDQYGLYPEFIRLLGNRSKIEKKYFLLLKDVLSRYFPKTIPGSK